MALRKLLKKKDGSMSQVVSGMDGCSVARKLKSEWSKKVKKHKPMKAVV